MVRRVDLDAESTELQKSIITLQRAVQWSRPSQVSYTNGEQYDETDKGRHPFTVAEMGDLALPLPEIVFMKGAGWWSGYI